MKLNFALLRTEKVAKKKKQQQRFLGMYKASFVIINIIYLRNSNYLSPES